MKSSIKISLFFICTAISLIAQEEVYLSYVYTYGNIAVFSYDNSSEFQITEPDGTPVSSVVLMKSQYELIPGLEPGVYKVTCNNPFSVVSGDPWGMELGAWTAVDQTSKPIGTKLLSAGSKYLSGIGAFAEGAIAVFAYTDDTHVLLENVDENVVIWQGDLDSSQYYIYRHDDSEHPEGFTYSIEATNPVSALTLNGMGGMYVPAYNGTFTGTDFMTYVPYCYQDGHLDKDIAVLPWHDSTRVKVFDLDNSFDTVWNYLCLERGVVYGKRIPLPYEEDQIGRALYIHSDKAISISHTPYASYGSTNLGFFLMRGMDIEGFGLGEEFHLPLLCSGDGDYTSRLHVIAYNDNTEISVSRTQKYTGAEDFIWEGTLDAGEYYRYTSEIWNVSATATYHVTSSKMVGTVVNCYSGGADFFPVINAGKLAVAEPVTPVTHPLTHSSIRIITTPRNQVILEYSDMPQGLDAEVFDASGRKIDELHSPATQGSIIWGNGRPAGVYFIYPVYECIIPQKIVLTK